MKILQLKEKGFKQARVASMLGIHRNTVKRYWDMSADEFEENTFTVNRTKLLSEYEGTIVRWLTEYPSTSAAQVCDWLKEHYNEYFKERTVSRYVKDLRIKYSLKKTARPRDYEAVEELPVGQQIQVDFGEKWMKSIYGVRTKVRFVAFVLSYSRFKYVQFQDRPFTAVDLVRCCQDCFRYIGGMPRELVFDQDSVVAISENCGDIVHTYEFEKLRQECKFSIYLCRKNDPESKGKIENVVKYVKYNFLENRLYVDSDVLNQSCLDWLDRTANAKMHGTTKRIPAEMFKIEREHLQPLLGIEININSYILRTVRKDNTIVYDSNRYSVPLGTYNHQKEVRIEVRNNRLYIETTFGEPICDHQISTGRGQLIKNTNHARNRTEPLDAAQSRIDELFKYEATDFLQKVRTEKSRYARDQFKLLQSLYDKYGLEKVLRAIEFCATSELFSATYVKEFLEYNERPQQKIVLKEIPVSENKYHITTQKRSLDVYAKVGGMR
ncbi:MAG: IS21 family transposase [Candidatus Cloacimonetes bacterium]|nr:IS21 family transposase [Candidatus Cloacimonadota bacterium]